MDRGNGLEAQLFKAIAERATRERDAERERTAAYE